VIAGQRNERVNIAEGKERKNEENEEIIQKMVDWQMENCCESPKSADLHLGTQNARDDERTLL
jgi:hypothetical protein